MKINKPDFYNEDERFRAWWDVNIEPINEMFADGVEVYRDEDGFWHKDYAAVNYKAILINIEPIKQETCADVLRDWLSHINTHNGADLTMTEIELMKKAKVAIEREGK